MDRNAKRDNGLNRGKSVRDTPVKRYMLIRMKRKVVDVDWIAIMLDTSIGNHVSKLLKECTNKWRPPKGALLDKQPERT